MRLIRRAVSVSLLVCLVYLGGPGAGAGETDRFGFVPHPLVLEGKSRRTYQFDIAEGGSVRDTARVFNKTDEEITLRVYGADVTVEGGNYKVAPFGTQRELGTLVRPERAEVTLGAKGDALVDFTVLRPSKDDTGFGAIVAEEVPKKTSEAISVVTRVALLVEIASGGRAAALRIESAGIDAKPQLFPSDATVSVHLHNGTARKLEVALDTSVRSLTGRTYELRPATVALEPGEKRRVALAWRSVPGTGGLFQATVKASYEGREASQGSPRKLVVPIWLALLLITIDVALIRKIRAQRKATASDR